MFIHAWIHESACTHNICMRIHTFTITHTYAHNHSRFNPIAVIKDAATREAKVCPGRVSTGSPANSASVHVVCAPYLQWCQSVNTYARKNKQNSHARKSAHTAHTHIRTHETMHTTHARTRTHEHARTHARTHTYTKDTHNTYTHTKETTQHTYMKTITPVRPEINHKHIRTHTCTHSYAQRQHLT